MIDRRFQLLQTSLRRFFSSSFSFCFLKAISFSHTLDSRRAGNWPTVGSATASFLSSRGSERLLISCLPFQRVQQTSFVIDRPEAKLHTNREPKADLTFELDSVNNESRKKCVRFIHTVVDATLEDEEKKDIDNALHDQVRNDDLGNLACEFRFLSAGNGDYRRRSSEDTSLDEIRVGAFSQCRIRPFGTFTVVY